MDFRLLFFLLCILVFSPLNAQKILHGEILIDDYDGEIFPIEVQNLSKHTHQITDNNTFNIAVQVQDTLLFESGVTETRKFVISPTIYNKRKLTIHLNLYIVHLKDIVVNDVLTGDLAKDMESANIVDHDSINDALAVNITLWDEMNMYERPLIKPLNGEIGNQVNLGSIGGLVLSLTKSKKKFPKPKKPKSLEEIRTYLGDNFFNEIDIPTAEIPYFMPFVADKNHSLFTSDYLEIIRIFSEQVDNYKNRNRSLIEKG